MEMQRTELSKVHLCEPLKKKRKFSSQGSDQLGADYKIVSKRRDVS